MRSFKKCLLVVACFSCALATLRLNAHETWVPRGSRVTVAFWGVAHGHNQWISVGEQGNIVTSPNRVAWTKRGSGFPGRWLKSVTHANEFFVALGGTTSLADNLGLIPTSTDGVIWRPRLNGHTSRLNLVAYGNGAFVALDDTGVSRTSPDGLA